MRRNLICFEFAAQATRCRLSKYAVRTPTEEEVTSIRKTLLRQTVQVRLILAGNSSTDSLVEMRLYRAAGTVFGGEDEAYVPPCLLRPESPPPESSTALASSGDSILDADSDGFSDDVDPFYHFDDVAIERRGSQTDAFQPLAVPARRLLPVKLVGVGVQVDGAVMPVVQPARHHYHDSVAEWHDQVDAFDRLRIEMKRSAPLFPDFEVCDRGTAQILFFFPSICF